MASTPHGQPSGRPASSGGAGPSSARLDELAAQLEAVRGHDPATAGPLWGVMHKLLLKAKADPAAAARIVAGRDLPGLEALVRTLRGEAPDPAGGPDPAAQPPASEAEIDPGTLKAAMRAFRRRIKLVRLDHESRLGSGPLSSGRRHDVDAIIPPNEFPPAVWRALAEAGKLRSAGGGFYELVEDAPGD